MERVGELVADARRQHPDDDFFAGFEDRLFDSASMRGWYQRYEQAFASLPLAEWVCLRTKALEHFTDHRPGQRKQGFFFQLNEAFAYEYLVGQGYGDVRFVQECIARRTADLSYLALRRSCHCEVKSVGISDQEIARRSGDRASARPYATLGRGVLWKIESAIRDGRDQLAASGTSGLVYIDVMPDDFTRTHDKTFCVQLVHALKSAGCEDVVLRLATADITIRSDSSIDEDSR